jgi:hypothetical protein
MDPTDTVFLSEYPLQLMLMGQKLSRFLASFGLACLLSGCGMNGISLAVSTPVTTPSPLPAIHSPTPPFVPSSTPIITAQLASPTISATALFTPSETLVSTAALGPTPSITLSSTPTFTITPTPASLATQPAGLVVDIRGCNTSLDLVHQMGEVTNAYPVIRNLSAQDLTGVCATLSASDEARLHPDKTACMAALPAGYQVTFKLTVDTASGQDTSIQVDVVSSEGPGATVSRLSCRDIGLPGWLPGKVGVVEPIPQ